MTGTLKYLIYEKGGIQYPVLFSKIEDHLEIAQRITGFPYPTIPGAGFVSIGSDGFVCYGKSVTLNVESRGDVDAKIMERHLTL